MAKGANLEFRSRFNSNRPIPPDTRSVAHAVTSSSSAIAESRTVSGTNRFIPSSAGLEPGFAQSLPPSAMKLLGQSPSTALAPNSHVMAPRFQPAESGSSRGSAALTVGSSWRPRRKRCERVPQFGDRFRFAPSLQRCTQNERLRAQLAAALDKIAALSAQVGLRSILG